MIIAFYNPAGNVGATTLAVHTCVLAHELGLRVAGLSAEATSAFATWLRRTEVPCERLCNYLGEPDADVIVLDTPQPDDPPIEPDVWVLPICDDGSAAEAT